MHEAVGQVGGWLIDATFAGTVLWVWLGAMLLHALWRSLARPEPDPIRLSGPIE